MRDNENRFAVPEGGESPAVHTQTEAPLSFASPTEIVELPSGGKLYPVGHPLHGRDTLEIRFMTAKDEDILTSRALIKKGIAIDRMLQNLIVDKTVKVEDLLLGDKNALTVAARISGYGADYQISVNCPSCEQKGKHSFDLSVLEQKQLKPLEDLTVEQTPHGTFLVTLMKTGARVQFRLMTGKDEAEMVGELTSKTVKKEENNSTSQLKRLIVSVNDNTDRRAIAQFVDNMPVVDAKLLRALVRNLTPDIDMRQDFTCSHCGHEEEVEIPFTVEFFWPK